MEIKFSTLGENCRHRLWSNESEWCGHEGNPNYNMYRSCKECNCPLLKKPCSNCEYFESDSTAMYCCFGDEAIEIDSENGTCNNYKEFD